MASAGIASYTTVEFRNIGVARHRADHHRTALQIDAGQAFDQRQIDQRGGLRQPQFHHRKERVAAGQKFGFRDARQKIGGLPHGCRAMEGEVVISFSFLRNAAGALPHWPFCNAAPDRARGGRHRDIFPADGVGDGVDRRGRRSNRARFAATLDAERVRREFVFGQADVERRQVVGPRHGVIHERTGHQLAFLVIDRALINAWPTPCAMPPCT